MKTGKIKKTIRPSERDSITGFSSKYGPGTNYEDKLRGKKIFGFILAAVCIIILIYIGFFITDVLIRFTEIPAFIHYNPEAFTQWISSLTIPG